MTSKSVIDTVSNHPKITVEGVDHLLPKGCVEEISKRFTQVHAPVQRHIDFFMTKWVEYPDDSVSIVIPYEHC